jgi:hypothetical protein
MSRYSDLPLPSKSQPNLRSDLCLPVDPANKINGLYPVSSLLRQGFFLDPDNHRTLHLPPKWQPIFFESAQHTNNGERICLLKDQKGLQRGILNVSQEAPELNRLSLTPRFAIEVAPARHDAFIVSLNDGGKRSHHLAATSPGGRKKRKAEVLAIAGHVVDQILPDIGNPLTRWDMQFGHVKKGPVASLKEAFDDIAGFVPPCTKAERRHSFAALEQRLGRDKPAKILRTELIGSDELRMGVHEIRLDDHDAGARSIDFPVYKQELNW